jgi:energy-coupling factor transporter ATP-binding protein EcfA2
MAKISEVVKLNSGYASAVNLKEEFLDTDSNRGRMERYQLVKSHREAFLRLTKSIEVGLAKDRCFLLTGNFGTGKSHLMLMLANYLHNTSDQPEITGFLSNWKLVDPAPVDRLKALRKNKRWLVAICDYGTNDDFEEVVLRAIADACGPDREDFHGIFETHYHEAIRKLDTWEEEERGGSRLRLYSTFVDTLQEIEPDYTVNKLRGELKQHREAALLAFKRVFKELFTTEEFTPSKSNLVSIIKDFTSSEAFKDRYDGLAILFDEFGYVLENRRISLNIWQEFAEFCNSGDRKGQPCIFVAAAHKSFANYAKGWDDFSKESGRIKEVPLTAEGIEDIIGAMVQPLTDNAAWASDIAPRENLLNGFASECKRLKIFDWLDAPTITAKISKGAYPMHPMATYCLLELAKEIGSNNRTAFTFFSTEDTSERGSFPWFINDHDILDGQNLRLYTADLLTEFFSKEMSTSNRELRDELRKLISNYETSLREFQKLAGQELLGGEDRIAEIRKVMRAMLVLQLVNVPCNLDNIAFSLFLTTPKDIRNLEVLLGELKEKRVLFMGPISRTYEFASAERVDIDQLIEDYRSSEENRPADLASEMIQVSIDRAWPDNQPFGTARAFARLQERDRILWANGHNNEWNEDKRAIRVFARPSDLLASDIFTKLEADWLNNVAHADNYDAVCVYVICEGLEDIEKARDAAAKNPCDRVLIAVPREPMPVTEAVMNLRAIKAIEASPNYDTYSTPDKAHISELIGDAHAGYQGRYVEMRNTYLDGLKAAWYGKNGRQLSQKSSSPHQSLDLVMDELYEKRNRVKHDEFNKSHLYSLGNLLSMKNKTQIKDAVQALLATYRDIEINTAYGDDKGQIKYLRKVMFNSQVLRQTGTPAQGVMACQVEHDESKYAQFVPALVEMELHINGLGEQDRLFIADFVRKYSQPPYGLGPTALLMFFACLLRMFGDQIVVKREQAAAGQVMITEFEHLWDLLSGRSPGAFMFRRPISKEQRDLLNELYGVFTGQPVGVSDARTVYEVSDAIAKWWDLQPQLARVKSLYTSEGSEAAKSFIDAMAVRANVEPSEFVFQKLQTICGKAEDDLIDSQRAALIVECVTKVKQAIEDAPGTFKSELLGEIRSVFGIKGVTYDHCRAGISEWFNALDENQRDLGGTWHTSESRALIRNLGTMSDTESTLFSLVPRDLGLGQVADWNTDKTQDYVAKLREGLKHTDENAIKVDSPLISCVIAGQELKGQDGKWQVQYSNIGCIKIDVPKAGVVVWLSDSGEDPSAHGAQVLPISDSYEYRVDGGNKTVLLVSRDSEGNFGKVCSVQFVDQLEKFTVKLPSQKRLEGMDQVVSIVLPPDADAFQTVIRSLVETSLNEKTIDRQQAAIVLREIADRLDGKAE